MSITIPPELALSMRFPLGSADDIAPAPEPVFSPLRVEFLAGLSKALFADASAKSHPDVAAFAFWCRRANIETWASRHRPSGLRIGLGPVFHVAPANVPINFAYSLAFAFLAGNTSIVRLPSRHGEQIDLVIRALQEVLAEPRFATLRSAIHLLRYEHDDRTTEFWLQNTLGRIIWGGDATVAHMRGLRAHPRSREIAFSDRYSFCVVNAAAILAADAGALSDLYLRFANDMYLMDQHACSSPHMLAWIGEAGEVDDARRLFWPGFELLAQSRYEPEPIQVMDKYVDTCREIIDSPTVDAVVLRHPALTRIRLCSLTNDLYRRRGYFGTLHELSLPSLSNIAAGIDPRCQTMTYFGFDAEELRSFVVDQRLLGLDRIVPIGKAHDMGYSWDGFDLIGALSRVVEIN
ncbi:MAG: hypothetical protein KA806_05360 [Sulfuritalea sp.]|nr:hypothetical protein [Sulfuritalea sp.]